jgi:hypothetical protein
MNGNACRGDQMLTVRRLAVSKYQNYFVGPKAGDDDERNDSIVDSHRWNLAGFLLADESRARPQGPARERRRRYFEHGGQFQR